MSQTSNLPTPTDNIVNAVIAWWRSLYPDPVYQTRGDAGARASIRRANSSLDVLLQPATHVMFQKVKAKTGDVLSEEMLRRLALAAAALCELRTTERSGTAFARALGANSTDEPARLSPLRFQNLMAAMNRDDDSDKLTALRRAMAMLKDSPINVHGLVRGILFYNDETRMRWTFAYFNTSRATEQDTTDTPTLSASEEPVS